MSTVELEAKLEDLPEDWRRGRTLRNGDVLVVKVTGKIADADMHDLIETRKQAARAAAGAWSDRTDDEIREWQDEAREGWNHRFRSLFPNAE